MSSRRASLRKRAELRSRDAAPGESCTASAQSPKKRGPRQLQPGDFRVTIEMPHSVPILERELRAIEILLGAELQNVLRGSAKER